MMSRANGLSSAGVTRRRGVRPTAAASTLANYLKRDLTARVTGHTVATDVSLYSSQDHGAGVYVRNKRSWSYPMRAQLSCISPWNSAYANLRSGTAITRRHVVCAHHWPLSIGSMLRFVDAGNVVHTATISDRRQAGSSDFEVAILAQDLPASIKPCQVLPANLFTYISSTTGFYGAQIPVVNTNQYGRVSISVLNDYGAYPPYPMSCRQPNVGQVYRDWFETMYNNDSACPCFMFINGRLALHATWTAFGGTGGGGAGSNTAMWITELNAAITALGVGGYAVEPANLSMFQSV